MKKDILGLLKNEVKNFTSSQRNVADYILKKPTESAFLTLEQLAREVGTSPSTIMRFALNLGYSGYSEFQKELQEHLRNQMPQARLKMNLQELDSNEFVVKCAQTQFSNISSCVETLTDELLNSCVDLLTSSNTKIYCTGLRMSYSVAHYLYHGLNRLLGNSHLLVPGTGDLPENLMNFSSSDVLIAICFPRYPSQTIEIVKVAKKRGLKVIAITDGYSSPLIEYSDIILPCKFDSMGFQNSVLGAMFIADTIISAIALKHSEKVNQRLDDVEKLLKEMNYHDQSNHSSV